MNKEIGYYTGGNFNEQEDSYTQSFLEMNQQNFWLPEEISLASDLKQWPLLDKKVQEAYSKNLTVLTFLDTWQGDMGMNVIGRSLDKEYHQRKALLNFMAAVEHSIHSRSYSSIFQSYLTNLEIKEMFNWCENQEEMQRIMDKIVSNYSALERCIYEREYGKGVTEEEYKIAQYKAMVSSVFLESALFYTGFYYPLWFSGQGKLRGAGEIISLIIRDECLTGDAELLTPNGWKNIKEIKKGDTVLEFDADKQVTQFNTVLKTSSKQEKETYVIKNKSGFYQKTSGGHSLVFIEDDVVKKTTMGEFETKKGRYFIRNSDFVNDSIKDKLTDEERIKIAIQADGSIDSTKREDGSFKRDGSRIGAVPVSFSLTRERKQKRLEMLINSLGYRYRHRPLDDRKIEYVVYVPVDVIGDLSKIKESFYNYDLSEVSSNWCKEFIEEVVQWDGHIRKDNKELYYFGTTNKSMFDFVVAVSVLAGYSIKTGIKDDSRKESYKRLYRLYIDKQENKNLINSGSCIKEVHEGEMVYGVQVPSTNIVIRQNGCISITGNCIHGLYVGMLADEILKELSVEKQEELKEWVHQLLKELYDLECKLIDHIYDSVDLSHDVKIFLRYNFNKALQNLNLENYFETEEVNPVVIRGIDVGSKQIDYFSQKGDSYAKRKLEVLQDEDFEFEDERIC